MIEENTGSWLLDWKKNIYFTDSLGSKRFNFFFFKFLAHGSKKTPKNWKFVWFLRKLFSTSSFLNFKEELEQYSWRFIKNYM